MEFAPQTAPILVKTGKANLTVSVNVYLPCHAETLPQASRKYRGSPSQMLFKIDVLKNVVNFTGKHLCWSLFLIKLQGCNFIKRKLQHRCFPVKFAKFLSTPFFTEHLWRLLL